MDREALFISMMPSKKIGDDAAVIDDMLYSADIFCEGTHFRREWMSMTQAGRKAMLVNISDAIAMNADPLYALVSVTLPRNITDEEISELADAIRSTASEYGCEVIGGDTVGGDILHISIALISHCSDPLLRTGIKNGDLLAYTGSLGESRRDLEALMRGEKIAKDSRFYEPVLRRDFIRQAAPLFRCGMDISDGLYCDLNKLLEANKTKCEILININKEFAMSGEEYEMLIAFDPDNLDKIMLAAKNTDTPLTIFARAGTGDMRFPCKSHHF